MTAPKLFVRVNGNLPSLGLAEWELLYVVPPTDAPAPTPWLFIVDACDTRRVVYEREIAGIVAGPVIHSGPCIEALR